MKFIAVIFCLLVLVAAASASIKIVSTTTVAAESIDKSVAQRDSASYRCGMTLVSILHDRAKFFSAQIDNCLTVKVAIVGDTLNIWPVLGDEASELTIDHYTVFVSRDNIHLMPLIDLAPYTRSLDLSRLAFRTGTYYLYVKAVGKPMFVHHLSTAVIYKR